ncbi:MAG: saccharopine dehydrogenase NADP-binding domain-containing protein [Candidatus Thorarchaeota archaeon]|nr:saccharopine dehydrogenase NADP-binding domain-containing protein [Candidatus Thorarchaeota archaeon]
MKCLVLGAGQMGRGVAYDLARNDDVEEIVIADIRQDQAGALAKWIGPKATAETVDARSEAQLKKLFSKVDAVASCVSYTVNLLHTKLAIEAGVHMTDLGGNLHIVRKQLELHDRAKSAGVTVIPDCGLAPGMTNVLARAGIDYLDKVEVVKIRVGGLQQEPRPPLNYSLIFSVEGLINEYVEPCMVLRDGKIVFEEPLVGFEQIVFPQPFGTLEAFNTSGGSSTLPITYEGRVKSLDYKTIRYPGHGHKMWCLMKLGFMDSTEQDFDGVKVAPRRILERLLERNLPATGKDVTLIRVIVQGWKGTESRNIEMEVIDYFDDTTGLTSMMRTTSFSQAIATAMTADGTIKERGVLPPELSIPPDSFIEELRRRGIDIKKRVF